MEELKKFIILALIVSIFTILGLIMIYLPIENKPLEISDNVIKKLAPAYEKCYLYSDLIYCCSRPLANLTELNITENILICDTFKIFQINNQTLIVRRA